MNKNFQNALLICYCLLIGNTIFAQKRTTLYAEFLGNGYAYGTLNVDYRIGKNDVGFGVRGGYSFGETANYLGMVNYLLGSNKHKIELGAGILNFSKRDKRQLLSSDISKGLKPTFNISYRYHGKKGAMFKVGWTPSIIDHPEVLYPWPGIAFGWRM